MLYWSSRKFPRTAEILPAPAPQPGSRLHLVRPLGFDISEKAVRRAGLDYWHLVEVADYESLDDLFRRHPEAAQGGVAHHHQGASALYEGPLHRRELAVFRQGDRGASGSFPGEVPGPLHPAAHGGRSPQPEPEQYGGRMCLRGAASDRFSRLQVWDRWQASCEDWTTGALRRR